MVDGFPFLLPAATALLGASQTEDDGESREREKILEISLRHRDIKPLQFLTCKKLHRPEALITKVLTKFAKYAGTAIFIERGASLDPLGAANSWLNCGRYFMARKNLRESRKDDCL
ncbi:hypothetical protein VNO77_02646 [Canavalia gladiata]|uniref:Uncharacterized protein n=1 Tax=Canavalia gladiata TaxID=3824 RepID=A0AAN9MZV4_CANGL